MPRINRGFAFIHSIALAVLCNACSQARVGTPSGANADITDSGIGATAEATASGTDSGIDATFTIMDEPAWTTRIYTCDAATALTPMRQQ